MARAKQADFDAAADIAQLLEALVKHEPIGDCGVEGYEDCATYEAALRRAASKGSLFRVVFGMQVLCSPESGLISQTSDVLEIDQGFIDSTARQAVQTAVDALRPAFLGLARQLREVETKLVGLIPATPAAAAAPGDAVEPAAAQSEDVCQACQKVPATCKTMDGIRLCATCNGCPDCDYGHTERPAQGGAT